MARSCLARVRVQTLPGLWGAARSLAVRRCAALLMPLPLPLPMLMLMLLPMLLLMLMLMLMLLGARGAHAAIPAAYAPLSIQPSAVPGGTEFDLTAAVLRARQQGKRLYVYLGAKDCAFCRSYEQFLDLNRAELVPHFAPYLVVDLRSSLRVGSDTLYLRVGRKSLPYVAFQQSIGDVRTRQVVYPSVWLLDTQLKPLMQMPAGTGTFQTVAEQLEILRLEQ